MVIKQDIRGRVGTGACGISVGLGHPPYFYCYSAVQPRSRPRPLPLFALWIMGFLNNAAYVIMIASDKSISEGGTASVFLFNVMPGLALKLSAPYWFDRVRYRLRMAAASFLMASSFVVVGYLSLRANAAAATVVVLSPSHTNGGGEGGREDEEGGGGMTRDVGFELLGVAMGGNQASLGEVRGSVR